MLSSECDDGGMSVSTRVYRVLARVLDEEGLNGLDEPRGRLVTGDAQPAREPV